jgi:hypothetical protein
MYEDFRTDVSQKTAGESAHVRRMFFSGQQGWARKVDVLGARVSTAKKGVKSRGEPVFIYFRRLPSEGLCATPLYA